MGKTINDGGAAFPWGGEINGGMSVRDYFAGQALAGLIASYAASSANFAVEADAQRAYADAMIAVRKGEQT